MTDRSVGVHHFFVDAADVGDGVVEITGEEAHHAARVSRVRPGEAITVADGSGRVIEAVVLEAGATVRAEVRSVRHEEPPRPAVTLYQAIAKGDRMLDAVEKSVEVGVRRFVPFVAERTIVRWDEDKRRKARERWKATARAAAKQCRSSFLTVVEDVRDGPASATDEEGPVVVLHEQAAQRLREVLPSEPPHRLVLVVGPEGGFAQGELEELRSGGARVATLGPRVLRSGTAGPVTAALVAHSYGTLG